MPWGYCLTSIRFQDEIFDRPRRALVTGSVWRCVAQVSHAAAPEVSSGIRLYQSNKFKEAASELKKAVKKDKNDNVYPT